MTVASAPIRAMDHLLHEVVLSDFFLIIRLMILLSDIRRMIVEPEPKSAPLRWFSARANGYPFQLGKAFMTLWRRGPRSWRLKLGGEN